MEEYCVLYKQIVPGLTVKDALGIMQTEKEGMVTQDEASYKLKGFLE